MVRQELAIFSHEQQRRRRGTPSWPYFVLNGGGQTIELANGRPFFRGEIAKGVGGLGLVDGAAGLGLLHGDLPADVVTSDATMTFDGTTAAGRRQQR